MLDDQDRPQGDTPDKADAAPTETRKFAGKYESVDALETGYKELESKLGQQAEAIKRLESLVTAIPPVDYGQPPAQGYAPPEATGEPTDFITRAEAEKIAEGRFEQRWREREAMARAAQQLSQEQQYWRGEFFRKNPDLIDDETLVWGVTREVGERYAHYPPHVFRAMMPTILDEIAGKTREKIAKIRGAGKAEADRQAAMRAEGQLPSGSPVAAPTAPAKEKTLDELRQEAIREEMDRAARVRQTLTP